MSLSGVYGFTIMGMTSYFTVVQGTLTPSTKRLSLKVEWKEKVW